LYNWPFSPLSLFLFVYWFGIISHLLYLNGRWWGPPGRWRQAPFVGL
jgi:hypothetical protein